MNEKERKGKKKPNGNFEQSAATWYGFAKWHLCWCQASPNLMYEITLSLSNNTIKQKKKGFELIVSG